MKTLYKRLITFFLGAPTVVFLVFIPFFHHLPMHILLLTFESIGVWEFYKMAKNKFELFPFPLILADVLILSISTFLITVFNLSYEYILWIFTIEILIFFFVESLTAKTFENSLSKMAVSTLIVFYMGFLTTFISRISTLQPPEQNLEYFETSKIPYESYMLILFFIFVFMCDSAAWFFGLLFGKKSRGIVAASPKKSVVGFIGGVFGSVACGVIFTLFFREHVFTFPIWKIILTGFFTALTAITGDLVESVFKRSTGVKDSGFIIPGRGGVMDCLDSLIPGAVVFYICVFFLFR